MAYLMESAQETERLLKKSDYQTSKQQLLLTGLAPEMTAVDAGGGAGFVTKIMGEIVGPRGQAILVDQSEARLDAAKKYHEKASNITYLKSPLEKISLDSGVADYVFCRFVFEYLNSPDAVLQELIRITKPGGRIVVGDLDYNVLTHFPLAEHLEKNLLELTAELQKKKIWDPYVGRKIYSMFHQAGLREIKVHMIPHHLIYGEAEQRDIDNWNAKLDQMESLVTEGVIQLTFDLKKFRTGFMKFFKDPNRFSYSPLLLVEAIKSSAS